MERNALQNLIEWNQNEHRKPPIVRGARQVGKICPVKDIFCRDVLLREAASENTHKKHVYTPIYEFVAGGNTIRKSGDIYSPNKKEFRAGDTVAVKYNPDQPEKFPVNGKSGGKIFGIALLLFGLVIIATVFTQR